MVGKGEDFVCGEDLDAILAAIDSDCFNNEVNFSVEMDALIDNISLELKLNVILALKFVPLDQDTLAISTPSTED